MKALVYTGTRRMEIREVPVPSYGDTDVLVKVGAAGICGSELEAYLGRSRKRVPPLVMGHEFTGVIEAIGSGVVGWAPGDRVAIQPLFSCGHCPECDSGLTNICRNRTLLSIEHAGGHSEYAAVPASALFRLPERVSMEAGTLAEPAANAVHIIERGSRRLMEPMVILGGGAIGALVGMVARFAGVGGICYVEPNTLRHPALLALGADLVVDSRDERSLETVREWSGGGAGAVVDASGASQARKFAIECAAPAGVVVFVGQGSPTTDADCRDILTKELTIRGSYAYTNDDFARALRLLDCGAIDAGLISRAVSLEEGPSAFADLADNKVSEQKMILTF